MSIIASAGWLGSLGRLGVITRHPVLAARRGGNEPTVMNPDPLNRSRECVAALLACGQISRFMRPKGHVVGGVASLGRAVKPLLDHFRNPMTVFSRYTPAKTTQTTTTISAMVCSMSAICARRASFSSPEPCHNQTDPVPEEGLEPSIGIYNPITV
jgi:hypothetical protein